MKKLLLFCFPLLFLSCPPDEPVIFGNQVAFVRLAIYDFDVNIEVVPGEDTFPEFVANDSTMILQISRTVDPDFSRTGDETAETIYIILPDTLNTLEISEDDWDDLKTFAYTSGTTVNEPIGRITGGEIIGQRFSIDNSWEIAGEVQISENFGSTFPLVLTGLYQSR